MAQTLSIGMLVAKFCQLSKPNVPYPHTMAPADWVLLGAWIHQIRTDSFSFAYHLLLDPQPGVSPVPSSYSVNTPPRQVLHLIQKYRIGTRSVASTTARILMAVGSWRIQGATKMPNMKIITEAYHDNVLRGPC